jgi:hypothetical protein
MVRSDDHWNFVEPLPPGAVSDKGKSAVFNGKRFKLYQDAEARVEHVLGEFYWKVMVGEAVRAADYIRPPDMLSKEVSTVVSAEVAELPAGKAKRGARKTARPAETGEINWSLGTYVKPREVEKRFGISDLPRPSTVAPNQPFPYKGIYLYWLWLMIAAIVVGIALMITGSGRQVFERTYQLQPLAGAEATHVIFSDPFELEPRKNIKVTARAEVDNTWLYAEGDLIEEATGLVQAFSIPVEYYHGVEDGESWSEGGKTASVHLSSLPAGTYTLRLEVSWERWQQPQQLGIKIEQGVPRALHFFLMLLLLSLIPLAVAIYQFSFEKRRWQDSDYSPFS